MELNDKQRKFVQLIANGADQVDAYIEAGYKPSNKATAETNASRLLSNAKCKEYLKELREAAWNDQVMTLAERMAFLSEVARTPAGKLSKESWICQEHKSTDTESTLKMPSKMEAVKELNKLQGSYAPEVKQLEITGGVGSLIDEIQSNL